MRGRFKKKEKMKNIYISVDPEEVLNSIGPEEAIKHYGLQEALEHVTVEQYLKLSDINEVIKEIDQMYDGAMEEFLSDKYSN